MCGVVAFIDLAPRLRPLDDPTIRRAIDSLSHRGPDASGFLRLDGGRVVLGHRRLSIVNVGQDADQPMIDDSNRVAVTFNGEIYNHLELRRALERAGSRFRTANSDTEVLVHGFSRWGWEGLLERIHGKFAFVLWDAVGRRLFAARDRLGIKPLYYAMIAGRLVLASEAKTIAALPGFQPRMNDIACLDVLNVLATPPPMTMFEGVFKLAAATTLCVDEAGGLFRSRYWHPPIEPAVANVAFADAAAEVESLARAAIVDRLPNEVEAGVMLSGGVDSGFILGVAAQAGHRLKAFTASFPDDASDESAQARETAHHFGCEHVTVEVDEREAMATVLQLMQDMDEPIVDSACLPLQVLSARAKADGIKVALVGEGADELFCGYPAWRSFIHEGPFWRTLAALRRVHAGNAAAIALRALAGGLPFDRLGLVGAFDVASAVAIGHGRFRSGAESMRGLQVARVLKADWAPTTPPGDPAGGDCAGSDRNIPLCQQLASASGGYPDSSDSPGRIFRNLRRRDLAFRLPELLLMRVDKITMASSIEARVPYLDHRLVEYVLRLPEAVVLGEPPTTRLGGAGDKPLFRTAVSTILPAATLARRKVGLGAPVARWLRGPLGTQLQEIVLDDASTPLSPFDDRAVRRLFERHRSGERDYASYLWSIANIALWRRRWLQR